MPKNIRVGIIGVSATGGWARESHVLAVKWLAGLKLAAVATNGAATAAAAAAAFDVKAYPSGSELIADPAIDVVTVATRVPDHRELVLAALEAGKHVYSEWPLGCGVAESEEMARAAERAGVHTAIGLQLRANPVARRAREIVRSGALGRLLGITVQSAAAGFGPVVPEPFAYLEDPANFANLLTIQGGHTIDLAIALAGSLAGLQALASTRYPEILVGDAGEPRRRTTFDHLLLQARTLDGATLAIEVSGGRPPETPFRLEAVGERGVLRLDGGAPRGFQSGRLALSVDGEPQPVEDGEASGMPDTAINVAGVYAAMRDDILANTRENAGFAQAVELTRLVEGVLRSSEAGAWVAAEGWPTRRHPPGTPPARAGARLAESGSPALG